MKRKLTLGGLTCMATFIVFSLTASAQGKKIKTDSLSWCACSPVTTDDTGLRKLSDCEKKFYNAVMKEVSAAFERALQEGAIPDFIVGEKPKEASPEYITKDASKNPFNVGSLGNPPEAPAFKWYMDNNSQASKDLIKENQDLVNNLKGNNDTGTTSADYKENVKKKFWEIGERGYAAATIYTNRNSAESFYGSERPRIETIEGVDQVLQVPFSQNEQARPGEGIGVTLGQTILLYGAYLPVSISKKPEEPNYNVEINTNIPAGRSKLKLYTLEIRMTGDKKNVDKVIALMDHQKIREAIKKYQ